MEYDDLDADLKETDSMNEFDVVDRNDGTGEDIVLDNFLEDE